MYKKKYKNKYTHRIGNQLPHVLAFKDKGY